MSNLIEIQGQIEKLQKQAQEIRSKEFSSTVQDILIKMQAYGISLKDLQLGMARESKGAKGRKQMAGLVRRTQEQNKKKEKVTKLVAAKYKGPNGETWSGRGLMPRWMAALVAQGQTKESFAIHG